MVLHGFECLGYDNMEHKHYKSEEGLSVHQNIK